MKHLVSRYIPKYYHPGNLNPAHLPDIQSIMMKTEPKEEPITYHPTVVYQTVKTDPDEYQPMHDSMIDFYGPSMTDFQFNHLAYTTTAQITYDSNQVQFISDLPYYSDFITQPVVPSTSPTETISTGRAYYSEIGQSSPNYSPPPQDPQIKPKKRIPAVPCHSNSICANCKTKETTLWRRNHVGEIECNACNLYYRKNNRKRPLSLKKDGILKRNRKPRCESPITKPRS
ncbi:unnamed protein product [Auanema sp. JU1783]|nr:unnamed protein product [Auanema sp. JU1783]